MHLLTCSLSPPIKASNFFNDCISCNWNTAAARTTISPQWLSKYVKISLSLPLSFIKVPSLQVIILLSVVMYASAGYLAASPAAYTTYATGPAIHAAPLAIHAPAYGSTTQHLVRSYDGTISQYAKAVDTPFSSVRKHDTRITNNLYNPGYGYAYPAAAAYPTTYQTAAYPAAYPTAYHTTADYAHHQPANSHVSFDGLGAHYAW